MKWWLWMVGGVLTGAVAVAVTVRPVDAALDTRLPRPATPTLADATDVPVDGELRVTEQGFSQRVEDTERTLTPGYGPGRPEPYRPVYAAFTLQNTSSRDVALNADVAVTYYDDRDEPVRVRDNAWVYTAPVLPGTSGTFAAFLSIDAVRVTRMTVEVRGARWLPAAAAATEVAALTARDVEVVPSGLRGLVTVTWTAQSALVKPVMAHGLLIYRDRAGRLLGAEHDSRGPDELTVPPGESTGSITVRPWYPPGTDRDRLSVTLRPGYRAADR